MLISQLKQLWNDFGEVSIDEEENIEQDFYIFPKGTCKYAIWDWFEAQNPYFSIAEMLRIKNP